MRSVTSGQVVGHDAALTEAHQHDPGRINRVGLDGIFDESLEHPASADERSRLDLAGPGERKPAIGALAGGGFDLHGTLRADKEHFALVDVGRDPEQIVGTRAEAM